MLDETLRLYPPAWVVTRTALADDVLDGVRIPAGALVIVCTYALHRHPSAWPDPERFDPSRFDPDRKDRLLRNAYAPFGSGPRLCIGRDFALLEGDAAAGEDQPAVRAPPGRPATRRAGRARDDPAAGRAAHAAGEEGLVTASADRPVRTVVLLHGYEGNGPTHWQTWLAERLPHEGVVVRYPLLPDPFAAGPEELGAGARRRARRRPATRPRGRRALPRLPPLGPRRRRHRHPARRPCGARRSARRRETTATFPRLPPGPLDAATLARASGRTDVVLGTDDPWRADPADFRRAGLDLRDVPGGAHLNVDAGLGPWPEMLDWVLDRGPAPGVAG